MELIAFEGTRNDCSFPKAIRLPDNVTAPMNVPSMMVIDTSGSILPGRFRILLYSAIATNAEAPPPRPLNIATN